MSDRFVIATVGYLRHHIDRKMTDILRGTRNLSLVLIRFLLFDGKRKNDVTQLSLTKLNLKKR